MPFRSYPRETRALLGAQLIFNLGFYAVVPFLAGAMASEFGMTAAAIGIVLGARTFSQQGMFLIGGLLADRWGARRSILAGCLVRIAGYAVLLGAADFTLFLIGAVLTGVGGALFSPALEAQLSHADDPTGPSRGTSGRRSVFVWLAIIGEAGAVVGPVLGSALLGWGLDAALTAGIAVFSAVTVLLWWRLPAEPRRPRRPENTPDDGAPESGWIPACLRTPRFVLFCALVSVNLLAYNQLYFAIPVELERRGLAPEWLGALFLLASLLTLSLQLPVAAAARRIGPGATLAGGFGLVGAAFVVLAGLSDHTGDGAPSAVMPVAVTVAVLVLGHMMITPTVLSLVPTFIPARHGASCRGAYYGLVATCGGVAVLAGNVVLGRLVDAVDLHHWWAGLPWTPLVLLALLSAVALPRVLPAVRAPEPTTQELTVSSSQ